MRRRRQNALMNHADRPSLTAWASALVVVGCVAAFDPWGWASFGPVKWAIATAAGFGAVAALLWRRRIALHTTSAVAWSLFLGWGVVVSLAAVDPLSSWLGTPDRHLGLAAYLLFGLLFATGQAMTGRVDVMMVLRAAVVALAAAGVYTLLELAGVAPVDVAVDSGRAGGPFGSAAYLGAACALLLPVAVGAAVDGLGSSRWRWAAVGAASLGGVAAVSAQTRAAWVGLAAAALVAIPVARPWLARRPWAVAAGVAVLVLVVVVTPMGDRLRGVVDLEDGTARGRIDEWQVGFAVLWAHPVLGTGFEGYRIAFPGEVDAEYERRYTRETIPDRAHNGALDVGVATGLVGMAAYLAAAGWLVVRAWRGLRSGTAWLAGVAAGIVGYLVQQQFLFPLAEVDPVFWVLAGLLVAATTVGGSRERRVPRLASLVALGLAAAALVAGGLDVAADHQARAALGASAAGRHDEALATADRAVALRPDSFRYRFLAASVAAAPGTAEGLRDALGRLDRALDLSPSDPALLSRHATYRLDLAHSAQDAGELVAAIAEWEALVAADPNNAGHHLQLGVALVVTGDAGRAEQEWLVAADLAPASAAPLTNLAMLYLDEGDVAAASDMIERARLVDPSSPVIATLDERLAEAQENP
jgi:O-antigen ligase